MYASGQILRDARTAFTGGGFWCDLAVQVDVKGHPVVRTKVATSELGQVQLRRSGIQVAQGKAVG